MAEAYGLTYCPSSLVPESKLSHNVEAHHRLVPKLIHHGGENNRPSDLKTFYNSAQQIGFSLKQSGKGVFALMRKMSLQGMTGLGVRLFSDDYVDFSFRWNLHFTPDTPVHNQQLITVKFFTGSRKRSGRGG